MMTGVFQSAKQENTKLFQVSVPDFRYEYKEKERIAGHEVLHIGEGVYMFCELIGRKECNELKLAKLYPDLLFFAYGFREVERINDYELRYLEREGDKVLLFVLSQQYKRHDEDTIRYALLYETERFAIPREYQEILQEFINQNNRAQEEAADIIPYMEYGWVVYGSREDFQNKSLVDYEHEQCGRQQITGKLGFRYEPDKYKKVNGWDPYFLCEGRIGKYVYPGIYHFEDSLRLPLEKISGNSYNFKNKRIFPLLNSSSLGDTWFCCLGKEEGTGGLLSFVTGIRARYICLDRQSEPVLRKISELLTDYKFGVKRQRQAEQIAPVIIDEKYFDELKKERDKKAAEYVIEDNAVELVAGYGFRNLSVLYTVIPKSDLPDSRDYEEHDLAYVLEDDLILVDWPSRRLEVPLQDVLTLKVKMVCDLGAGICENAAVTVLDIWESWERDKRKRETRKRETQDFLPFLPW